MKTKLIGSLMGAVFLVVGILAGCGGSSGTTSVLTSPSPSPSASPVVQAVRAVYGINTGGVPQVAVSWEASRDIPQANVIEYHVFRDDALIGATNPALRQFSDSYFTSSTSFNYQVVGRNTTGLEQRTAVGESLIFGVPHVYRVTVLFRQTNGVYAETVIGTSPQVAVPLL